MNRKVKAALDALQQARDEAQRERDTYRQWYESLMATRMTAPEQRAEQAEARLVSLQADINALTADRDYWWKRALAKDKANG